MTGLGQIAAGWPLAASLAIVLTTRGMRAGRRRSALNEALHEVRRPIQAVALAASGATGPPGPGVENSIRLAAAALERLEGEINGGPVSSPHEAVSLQPLLQAAVGRWKARAVLCGGSLELRWQAGRAVVSGNRCALAQALDNLIVNAIEHGGSSIVVEAGLRFDRVRVLVGDSGRASRPESRRDNPADVIARLLGSRRRGHGLPAVRRVAAAHGGRFALRHSEHGSLAVLELPLAVDGGEGAA
jgi:signal transduction histidine kinase